MAPRSSWKGYLRLSLLSIPVKAYTAVSTSGDDIQLHQLHRGCHQRIRYQKHCPVHGEVAPADIVSGYESAAGQYVVVDPDELDALRTASDKSIRFDTFIRCETLDPVYHSGRTYYLVPDGPIGQRAYSLLRRCLDGQRMQGLAQIVLSGREQLVLLRPVGRLLAMTVLNYEAQVKAAALFEDEVADAELTPQEIELGNSLLGSLSREEFDFAQYEDGYRQRLARLIEAKLQGQPPVAVTPPEEPPATPDLLEALQSSLQQVLAPDPATADTLKPPPKLAPSLRERTAEPQRQKQLG